MTSRSGSETASVQLGQSSPPRYVANQIIEIVDLTGSPSARSSQRTERKGPLRGHGGSPVSKSKIPFRAVQSVATSPVTNKKIESHEKSPRSHFFNSFAPTLSQPQPLLSAKRVSVPLGQSPGTQTDEDQNNDGKVPAHHLRNKLTKDALDSHNKALSSNSSLVLSKKPIPASDVDKSKFSVTDEESSESEDKSKHATTSSLSQVQSEPTDSSPSGPSNMQARSSCPSIHHNLRSPASSKKQTHNKTSSGESVSNSEPSVHAVFTGLPGIGVMPAPTLLNRVDVENRTPNVGKSRFSDGFGRHKTPNLSSASKHRRSYTVDLVEPSKERYKLNLPQMAQSASQQCCVTEISATLYKANLQKHLHQMRLDQSYYVKSRLKRAREAIADPHAAWVQTESPLAPGDTSTVAGLMEKNVGRFGIWVKGTSERNNEAKRYRTRTWKQEKPPLPPYTAYISAKRNVLTEDDKQRTCLPYLGDDFANEDEEYAALETKIEENQFRNHRVNVLSDRARMHQRYAETFLAQIGCSVEALLHFLTNEGQRDIPSALPDDYTSYWSLRSEYLMDGYYEVEDDSDALQREDKPYQPKPEPKWQQIFEQLPHVYSRDLAIACVACKVFMDTTGFSLFHIVRGFVEEAETLQNPYLLGTYAELGCFICKVHECPGHGEYHDTEEAKNLRDRVNFKPGSPEPNMKQDYRINAEKTTDLLGLQADGEVAGLPWTRFQSTSSHGFDDAELCSEGCFWVKDARINQLSTWQRKDEDAFQMLRPAFEHERRGPCLMAQFGLIEKTCKEIFLKLLLSPSSRVPYSIKIRNELETRDHVVPARKTIDQWFQDPHLEKAWRQDAREPFLPCDHLGPCSKDTGCSCFEEGVHCEKSCACSSQCTRRFQGCRCHVKGRFCRNETCDCRRMNRECDPDLCISCGAEEVLNPVNRHNEEVVAGKCGNAAIQRAVPKRTLLGPSKLMSDGGKTGWGLYMGEECRKGDFIGEYRGEIISGTEADQRGTIYDKRNMSYLFGLNGVQVLDSTILGNKLRFINHQADPMSNCFARLLLCNGVVRIGVFALQNIAVGQEMFFDYGEGFATKFDLIKMNADGTVTVERPVKRPKAKEAFKRRITETRPTSQYQLKNKVNKNGHRVGRPPKKGRRLPMPLPVPKIPNTTSTKRGRSFTSEERDVDFAATTMPTTEVEEAVNPRKRSRVYSPEPDSDNIGVNNGRVFRRTRLEATKLNTASRSPASTPIRQMTRETSSQISSGMTMRGKSGTISLKPQSPLPTPVSEHFNANQQKSNTKTEELSEDQEDWTPRRSSRRRQEKQHFEEAVTFTPKPSTTPTPTKLRRTARKEAR